MGNVYNDKLDTLHEAMNEAIAGCSTCAEKLDLLKKEFASYSDIISSFFVGKKDSIKNIYTAIRENSFPYNKIYIVDINLAAHNYADYFNGLCKFVNMICDLKDTDDQSDESIKNTLANVRERDTNFVSSLFSTSEKDGIDSAMVEVEVLIDIYKELDEFVKVAEDSCNTVTSNACEKYKESILDGYDIFISSIRNYSITSIKNIIAIFSAIEDSIKNRESVKGSEAIPKYRLF